MKMNFCSAIETVKPLKELNNTLVQERLNSFTEALGIQMEDALCKEVEDSRDSNTFSIYLYPLADRIKFIVDKKRSTIILNGNIKAVVQKDNGFDLSFKFVNGLGFLRQTSYDINISLMGKDASYGLTIKPMDKDFIKVYIIKNNSIYCEGMLLNRWNEVVELIQEFVDHPLDVYERFTISCSEKALTSTFCDVVGRKHDVDELNSPSVKNLLNGFVDACGINLNGMECDGGEDIIIPLANSHNQLSFTKQCAISSESKIVMDCLRLNGFVNGYSLSVDIEYPRGSLKKCEKQLPYIIRVQTKGENETVHYGIGIRPVDKNMVEITLKRTIIKDGERFVSGPSLRRHIDSLSDVFRYISIFMTDPRGLYRRFETVDSQLRKTLNNKEINDSIGDTSGNVLKKARGTIENK